MLASSAGQPGASRHPPETAHAPCHGATVPRTNRAATAVTAAVIAAMASAHADPAGPGGTGSAGTATAQPVNTARTASQRSAKRRSHPRTVSAGRPSDAAIRRNPAPPALASTAVPITTTTSARRKSTVTGNNTCVTPHEVHRVRRGVNRSTPCSARTDRGRARPSPRACLDRPDPAPTVITARPRPGARDAVEDNPAYFTVS